MSYVIGLLVTLGLLIVVHEWGHYRMAVAQGVKVLRFSVGFGRVLWRRQSGPDATEFVLCALPLGGYVRMLDEREGEVPAAERSRAFNVKPLRARAAIVAAGPIANLLLAVLLFAGAYWVGVREPVALLPAPVAGSLAERAGLRAGDRVQAVADVDGEWQDVQAMTDFVWQLTQAALHKQALRVRVTDADGRSPRVVLLDLGSVDALEVDGSLARRLGLVGVYREAVMGEIKAGGPAAQAGVLKGDRVLAVDGRPVPDASALHERIRAGIAGGAGTPQRWQIDRAGQVMELSVTPRVERAADAASAPFGRIDAYIGKAPAAVTVRLGPLDGLARGAQRTWDTAVFSLRMMGRMLIGEASLRNLSGPISIADYAGQSVQQGPSRFLEFLAIVSVSLGVLNLLPLPLLDGGHLMVYIFEGLTGRPVSEQWMARLQRGGLAVLLMMMSVAFYNDVARLLGLQ